MDQSEKAQIAKALVMTENAAIKFCEINGTSLFISYLLAVWGKSSLSEREDISVFLICPPIEYYGYESIILINWEDKLERHYFSLGERNFAPDSK